MTNEPEPTSQPPFPSDQRVPLDGTADFTHGSIPRLLTRFMLPILGALVLQAMYGAVDLVVVGHFGTTAGVSGVSTGCSVVHLLIVVLNALTVGVTVLIGRYLGAGDTGRLGRLIGGAVTFFLLLSLVMTAVMAVFAEPLARLMQAPPEALAPTAEYIRICGFGGVFMVFYNFISSIFRGIGDSKLPLLFVGIACAVNIVGDLILVAGLGMDVAGAAWATIAAQAVSVLLSLVIIRRRRLPFRLTRADLRLNTEVWRFLKIGLPLAAQETLTNVTFLALCAFINRLGLAASSGYGVAQRIVSFVMLIPGSLMQSMAPFVSQNVGAGQPRRARDGMKFGMLLGASIGVAVGLAAYFGGDLLASVFDNDPEVIAKAFEYLRGFAPEAVVTCILFSYLGYFNGNARSLFVLLQGLAQSLLIRLPMSYLMSIRPNASLTGIGLAAPTATVFGILICTVYYLRMNRPTRSAPKAE